MAGGQWGQTSPEPFCKGRPSLIQQLKHGGEGGGVIRGGGRSDRSDM